MSNYDGTTKNRTIWDKSMVDQLVKLAKLNFSNQQISDTMGLPLSRVQYKARELKHAGVIRGIGKYPENAEKYRAAEDFDITATNEPTRMQSELEMMQQAAVQIEDKKAEPKKKRNKKAQDPLAIRKEADAQKKAFREAYGVSVHHRVDELDDTDSPDMDALWGLAETASEKKLKKIERQGVFDIHCDTDQPIAISFISDQHIAPNSSCDFVRMRADAELIRETDGLYACLAGDGVDNHIKHCAAIIAAQSTPDEQWMLFDWYLKLFAEKILVMICGNHDAWTAQVGGTDMLKHIADNNKLHYSPHAAFINLTLGSQEYHVAFRHQYRFNSTLNQTHCVKQWYRMGEQPFDIGVIGHHHEAAIEAFQAHGSVRWAARPGAYQIQSAYSHQYGFNKAKPTCPTFILFPDKREIIGFWDVRHAVVMLNALRK